MKPGRLLKIAAIILASLVALVLVAVGGVVVALNTAPGQRLAAAAVTSFSGHRLQISGLSGALPALRARTLILADARGAWLQADQVAVDWNPWALLRDRIAIKSLTAGRVALLRRPVSSAASGSSGGLPFTAVIGWLDFPTITLGPALLPGGAIISASGSLALTGSRSGSAELAIVRRDSPGRYQIATRIDDHAVAAHLVLTEPAGGLISSLARLPGLGAVNLDLELQGPWAEVAARLRASSGPLQIAAHGKLDLPGRQADFDLSAHAPAMALRPDLRWQSLALESHIHGGFSAPRAEFSLDLDNGQFGAIILPQLHARGEAAAGQAELTAILTGLRIPGPHPNLFAAAPIRFTASADLAARPVRLRYRLSHPLFSLSGNAQPDAMQATLTAPDLAPFTDGHLSGAGYVKLSATRNGGIFTIHQLTLQNAALQLQAAGRVSQASADLTWQLALPDLHAFAAKLRGHLALEGTLSGPTDDLSAHITASGAAATPDQPLDPLEATIQAGGLPRHASGSLVAHGTFYGAPLGLAADAAQAGDGALAIHITQADWLGARLAGELSLAAGAQIPTGQLTLRIAQLARFQRMSGLALAGSVTGDLTLGKAQARLAAQADGVSFDQIAIARATLAVTVKNPQKVRDLSGTLDATGITAHGIGGTLHVTANGNPDVLNLSGQTNLTNIHNAPLVASLTARLEANQKRFILTRFQAEYQNQTLALLAPARLDFRRGLTLDQLRLGWRGAVARLAGTIAPAPDLRLQIGPLPASLIASVDPALPLAGILQTQATLAGSWRHPQAQATLAIHQLRMTQGDAAALPALDLAAQLALDGTLVHLNGQLSAGKNRLTVQGTAGSQLDLRADGELDLASLDPILEAQGQNLGGQASLAVQVAGTPAAPQATGTLRLTGGAWRNYNLGARLTAITATLTAHGSRIDLTRFSAQAGTGTLSGSGQISLTKPYPIEVAIKASQAKPLASDQLSATLNANLRLHGDLAGAMTIDGMVLIQNAAIAVPDSVSSQVAVLNVRRPGQAAPVPATGSSPVALSIDLVSPGQLYVRGRGLNAELAGRLHIGGTTADPLPLGKFTLRRGSFNLAGQPLDFTSGEIGFEGGTKIDPTLNFVATSTTSSITATLTVTGTASKPKITLSSTPEMPQDEILAQLLFHTNSSSLNALQLAQIAAGLAQISGATGSFDPLNTIRSKLGLDTLTVGNSDTSNGATVQAGRYVSKRVYIGASQDTSGGGTPRVTVQVDLLKGLKLETNVATSATAPVNTTGAASTIDTGSNIGLTYEFQY